MTKKKWKWWGWYTKQEFSVLSNILREILHEQQQWSKKKNMLHLFWAYFALWFWEGDYVSNTDI